MSVNLAWRLFNQVRLECVLIGSADRRGPAYWVWRQSPRQAYHGQPQPQAGSKKACVN